MKVMIFSGSHPRHHFIHQAILGSGMDCAAVVMERESLLPSPPTNISTQDKENFVRHFRERDIIESKFFGKTDSKEVFSNIPTLFCQSDELNSFKTLKFVQSFNPDWVFIFGVDIIKDPLLKALPNVVIEDVCQSLGSNNNGKFAGSFSDFAITSFGTGKIIDMEVGGILSTNSNSIYMSALEDYSKLKTYDNKIHSASKDFSKIYDFIIAELNKSDHSYMLGDLMIKSYKDIFVSKLDDKKYPVVELEKRLIELNKNIQLRNKKANFFQKNIKHKNIKVLIHNEGSTYWRQNILVSKNRDELLSFLKRNNVKATKYFPSLDKLFYHQGKKLFKNSNKMDKQIINLWPGEETSQKDIIKINELIKVFYEKK